jgi:hypothetical protein
MQPFFSKIFKFYGKLPEERGFLGRSGKKRHHLPKPYPYNRAGHDSKEIKKWKAPN